MTLNRGDYVSVYDRNGNLECRGNIVGVTHSNPAFYDVAPRHEFSMASRVCGIPASRVRKAYGAPKLCEPKYIKG